MSLGTPKLQAQKMEQKYPKIGKRAPSSKKVMPT
jgi:hypothetical protein